MWAKDERGTFMIYRIFQVKLILNGSAMGTLVIGG